MDDVVSRIVLARAAYHRDTGHRPLRVRLGRAQVDALLALVDVTSDALPILSVLGLAVVTDAREDVLLIEA